MTLPCRIITGWPSTSASTSTPSPIDATQGALMKTAWNGSSRPGDVEVHLERLVLPAKGVALDDDVHRTELGLRVAGGALGQENHPRTRAEGG